jgi:hypothetical protein
MDATAQARAAGSLFGCDRDASRNRQFQVRNRIARRAWHAAPPGILPHATRGVLAFTRIRDFPSIAPGADISATAQRIFSGRSRQYSPPLTKPRHFQRGASVHKSSRTPSRRMR